MILALLAATAVADPGATPLTGEELYVRCAACHSLDRDRTGPRHCGLDGRPAGTVPGFDYSVAMRASGIVWSAATLDTFLKRPAALVPGTRMPFAGLPDDAERATLVAWLLAASQDPTRCPTVAEAP